MDSRLFWEILAIVILILANGFFSLAEFSIIASRKSKLKEKLHQKKPGAAAALKLHEDPERFLATIQVGITAIAAMVGVFSGATLVQELAVWIEGFPWPMVANGADAIAMVVIIIFVTILSVVIGELVPKYLALSFPERYARRVARPVTFFVRVISLFARALSGSATLIVRLFVRGEDASGEAVSEEEINQMLIDGRAAGVFDETEKEFVQAVFDFADSTVRRAMTPRTDVIGLSVDDQAFDLRAAIAQHGYSRYPVYEGTIDHVVGVIYSKDALTMGVDPERVKVSELMRKPYFAPDSMPLAKLLREFQKGHSHMVIVLDEFGGTAGIITLEDVIEELVGEIQDEYDAESTPLVKHSDWIAYADSSVWPGDVNELLDCHLPEDNVDTLVGLMMDKVGRLPRKRETMTIADARLTVLTIDRNRILRIKVEKLRPDQSQDS